LENITSIYPFARYFKKTVCDKLDASRIFASLQVRISIPGTGEKMVKFEQPHNFLILIKEALARKISGPCVGLSRVEALIFLDFLVLFGQAKRTKNKINAILC
jgi:hypothetical protein